MTGYRLGFGVAALIGVAGLLAARTVPRSPRLRQDEVTS